MDGERCYWLIWGSDPGEKEIEELKNEGYDAEETFHNGGLGTIGVHIYHLKRK